MRRWAAVSLIVAFYAAVVVWVDLTTHNPMHGEAATLVGLLLLPFLIVGVVVAWKTTPNHPDPNQGDGA